MTTPHYHFVSHSHWDREWYQTFQQFRLRLVHLVDKLLAILDADPRFRPVEPFIPGPEEQTDFERWYIARGPIGRCSYEKPADAQA